MGAGDFRSNAIFAAGTDDTVKKGSAWVPAFAGTHAPGRAGQHFDLFDSIPLPHNT